jgi:hypothetical protein
VEAKAVLLINSYFLLFHSAPSADLFLQKADKLENRRLRDKIEQEWAVNIHLFSVQFCVDARIAGNEKSQRRDARNVGHLKDGTW